MIKTLIFDFDGTLVDSHQLINSFFVELKNELGYDHLSDNFLEQNKELSLQKQIELLHLSPLQVLKISSHVQKAMTKYLDQVEWQPLMMPVLIECSRLGMKLGILSSNSRQNLLNFLKGKQCQLFDFVYSGKNLFGKHLLLKKIVKQRQLNKNEVLYIGDETRDVEACQKVGIKVAAVCWGMEPESTLTKAKPSYLLTNPRQLLEIIKNNSNI